MIVSTLRRGHAASEHRLCTRQRSMLF